MKPILRYIELNNGRCGLSIETPAKIMREQGTANVRGIRPATEADVVHVRSMGGDVPDGRIIAGQVGTRGVELTTDQQELRAKFESLARDSHGFSRSRKGTYVNPQIARDWKWFQLGHAYSQETTK